MTNKIKQLHKAVSEICQIYDDEGVPKFITYPFFFVFLGVGIMFYKERK